MPDNQYAGNKRVISISMQRAVNTTIEEAVFSIDPPRDYISSPVVNQK
jgi:hypothetical protein